MNEPLRVLLVERDDDDEGRLREHMESTAEHVLLRAAGNVATALEIASAETFHVILLDLSLPDSSGLGTLARVQLAAPDIPIVVLTGEADEALGLRAVQAGADDYLIRTSTHATELWRTLRYAMERRRAARRIRFQADLLEQIGEAVVATDNAGIILYWNAAAEKLFGWPAGDVTGTHLRPILPIDLASKTAASGEMDDEAHREGVEDETHREGVDDETRREEVDDQIRRKGVEESRRDQVAIQCRDGRSLLVAVTESPLRDEGGAVIGRVFIASDITARHEAESALRESERRLRLFVDALPTILWTTDSGLCITSLQGAGLRPLGDMSDAIGRHVSEYAAPEVVLQGERALAGEAGSAAMEWGGREFDLHIEPMRDSAGTITGTIGIALDITERRRSEQAAAQYLDLLGTIVDAAPLAIVVVDADGNISLWNRAAERMLGWQAAEVLGQPSPHVLPEDVEEFNRSRAQVRDRRAEKKIAGRRVRKDGHVIDVTVTAAAVYSGDGRFHGTMGIIEDVTEQRLSEDRQRRLTAIIDASPDFVGTFDTDHRTLFINRSGRTMVGLAADYDATATTLEQFFPADTAEMLERDALPRAIADGMWSGEAELRRASGEDVQVLITVVAHRAGERDPGFISVVAKDISERRFFEDQLRQSQKMEAVGRLAGGVAHDFNNLLTAIAGHAELLLEDLRLEDKSRADLEEVLRAVDRASRLTRQLLAFSRRQVLQPTVLDVNRVITELGVLMDRVIGVDVEIELQLEPDAGLVHCDRAQLEQVVMNLLVNARDALPTGGQVVLHTTATSVTNESPERRNGVEPGDYVEIIITDNGTGMDEALLARIFEPFFTTKSQGRGTGLGLPTAFGIVTQTGGHILVDSTPGEGSTFRVLLPREGPSPQETTTLVEKDAVGSETILLVEDEPAVRRLGCRILERRGYVVLEADSGPPAIRTFEQAGASIALLVTDVIMPVMSGVELAAQLRKLKPGLPVLFTSGYTADAIERTGGLDAGTAFLEKPFTPESLARKVRDVLDGRAG